MKAIYKLSAIALAATALLASCTKVEEDNVVPEKASTGTLTFTCSFAQADPETKVAVANDGKATWEVGDQILINAGSSGTSRRTVTLTADDISNDGLTATITIPDDLAPYDRKADRGILSTYYAMYPASAVAPGSLYYNQAFSQTNAMLMAACNVENTFVFYNLCGIISFKVSGDYDSYVFSGNDGETVGYEIYQARVRDNGSGPEVTYLQSADTYKSFTPLTQIDGTVTADGSTLNYVCLPTGANFTKGFNFTFLKNGVPVDVAKSSAAVDVAHGVLLNLGDISSHLEEYVAPQESDHKSDIPTANAVDLSTNGFTAANCYVISAPGTYKFPALVGNSDEPAGNVFGVELLWETYNNETSVTKNSVIAQVDFEDNWIYFTTPETLKPGNAVIAAKNSLDMIIWSWHIWIPETTITSNTYSLYNKELMDRYLGALVAATTDNVPVESFGLIYQWGRKDPFVGAKRTNSSNGALVAGKEMSVASGTITLEESIQNPTLYGTASSGGDWCSVADNTLWLQDSKTIYDPCPFGYRVPARDQSQPLFASSDISTIVGWSENAEGLYFTLGNPVTVFPFAGYREEGSGGTVYKVGSRVVIWTSYLSSTPGYAYHMNVRAASTHKTESTSRARGGSIRCVKDGSVAPIPAPNVEFAIDGDFSEWASVQAIEGSGAFKVLKVGSDADKIYLYFECDKDALAADASLAYTNYMTWCFDNGDGGGSKSVTYWNGAKYDNNYQTWMTSEGNYKLNNWSLGNFTRKSGVDGSIVKYECCFDRTSDAVFGGKKLRLGIYFNGQTVDTSSGSEVWGGSSDPIGFAPAADQEMVTVALK